MTKRLAIDLSALTAEAAEPMQEASQRVARTAVAAPAPPPLPAVRPTEHPVEADAVRTANLEALAFKVSPAFRKRFRQCAVDADLKLNELLFEALDAWEEKRGRKR